ncbi:uncharacterized protein PHACADRAFT_105966 [Phanerochaete carnosa HHB-10118-sp]|uniref:Glycoside hydrolase family 61 protein n=1 Tax=Phanerochaete carnosa (strain HHB-10118-sp) TaxID=650164 RepID=K5WIY7_PHACS|nr:uncharacterized protein PHACADRAFT_105966 [Phanerochaete carnosa HHB-10118-sp]EKM50212.1 hypothetical protein PHACADRAFT_105966 [Phanerochaete carnosa HHB-10118-sp]
MFASFSTLFATSAAIACIFTPVAHASPTSAGLSARDDYAPSPILPNAQSVWTIGEQGLVTWNKSLVPSTATTIPWIDLYESSPFGSAEWVVNLAQNADPQPGEVLVPVPDVAPGSYFTVGAWGQSSTHFEIVAA